MDSEDSLSQPPLDWDRGVAVAYRFSLLFGKEMGGEERIW